MELREVAEELYGLPPDEFTGTRNQRAKDAKPEGKDLAEAIKRLPKPSAAAWVVNMLARHASDLLTQVLDLGVSLRQAQEDLEGDELRSLTRQRRQLTAGVTTQARRLARELGVKVSDTVAEQVEGTLRAAMADEEAARAVRTGQLVQALSATGLGDLDVSAAVAVPEAIGMTARPVERARPQLSVVESGEPDESEELQRVLADARRAADEASRAAAQARKQLDRAERHVTELEARSMQLQGELEEVRRRASELENDLENVDEELSDAEEERDAAAQEQERAASADEQAREELRQLE